MFGEQTKNSSDLGRNLVQLVENRQCDEDINFEVLDLQDELFVEEACDERLMNRPKKRKNNMKCIETRKKWNIDEETEIVSLCRKNFKNSKAPNNETVKKAQALSKNLGGSIHKRSYSSLKNKIFRMYQKKDTNATIKNLVSKVK